MMLRDLIHDYPELAAVAVLLVGIVLARIAAAMTRRMISVMERLAARFGGRGRNLVSPFVAKGISLTVFVVVLALAVVVSVRLLDITQLSVWLDSLLAYVPQFILGLLIIGVGVLLGSVARNIGASLTSRGDVDAPLPRLAQAGVVLISVVTGLQQIGIDISFITQVSLLLLAALLGGLSLAFGLGAREYVANLLGQSELARFSVGDRLRIDDDEGEIVEIYRTGITLATEEGLLSVPAARLTRDRVLHLRAGHSDD